ncbi:MAG: hypothetical protein ABI923_11030 [bacterium]
MTLEFVAKQPFTLKRLGAGNTSSRLTSGEMVDATGDKHPAGINR